MKPGALGKQIDPSGHSGNLFWSSDEFNTDVLRIVTRGDYGTSTELATFYGPMPLRLERVAAFIGYLQDEAVAAAETV